jgi:hypothetical protein
MSRRCERARESAISEATGAIVRKGILNFGLREAGDEPAVLLITYAGTPGVPTSVPAQAEKAEY